MDKLSKMIINHELNKPMSQAEFDAEMAKPPPQSLIDVIERDLEREKVED